MEGDLPERAVLDDFGLEADDGDLDADLAGLISGVERAFDLDGVEVSTESFSSVLAISII